MAGVDDDLTPGEWNFTRTRGDVMRGTSFAIVIDGTPATTAPLAQVKASKSNTAAVVLDLDATVSGNNIVVGADVDLDVDPGVYYWDLEVDDLTVVAGTFQILDDVSEVTP